LGLRFIVDPIYIRVSAEWLPYMGQCTSVTTQAGRFTVTDAIVPVETGLSDVELRVAQWVVESSVPGQGAPKTAQEVADESGVTRQHIYKVMRRPEVVMESRRRLREGIDVASAPRILRGVLQEAENDPKFGLQVLKWLSEWGIGPFGGVERRSGKTDLTPQSAP
jgi:hypothetical protein